jgi:tRNA(fMet)-specific endonuclease VapC
MSEIGRLLDTNAVIALQKKDPQFLTYAQGSFEVYIPVIVVGELYFGAYNSLHIPQNIQAIQDVIDDSVILACDLGTAENFGKIRHQLKAKGRPIPENDIWIAAIAMQYDLIVVTRDAHFHEIDGVTVEAW